MSNNHSTDPITLSVIQAGLNAACDEMFAVLKKTAMSPIIYEVLDVGTGITDASGRLLSSGAGIPTFVGVLDKAVMRIIELHEHIAEGDMFICNDPYFGGVTHLNDVVVAMPVFFEDTLIAWTASIAHWNDVGGKTAGSMSTDTTEIFQEGLRLPAVKLFDKGELLESVFDIIVANSRQPDFVRGDLWAQIAASRKASMRILELINTYGTISFHMSIDQAFEEGKKRSRAGLKTLQKGHYTIEEEQDDGAVWKASITITADEFIVDLQENPEQYQAPYNTSRDGAFISCQMVFKALTDQSRFANAGSFQDLKVLTKEGTIFHATGTAPHAYYFETRIRLYDMLWQCMAKAMPELLPAGHFASICGTVIAGMHPDTGRNYTLVEPQMGGWGATSKRDGLDAMYSGSHGDTFNCPVEICEARYGIEVVHKKMNKDEIDNSIYKGGRGLNTRYRMNGSGLLSAGYSRNKIPVWALEGGTKGTTNSLTIHKATGESQSYAFASGLALETNDEIEVSTANGGGWGKV